MSLKSLKLIPFKTLKYNVLLIKFLHTISSVVECHCSPLGIEICQCISFLYQLSAARYSVYIVEWQYSLIFKTNLNISKKVWKWLWLFARRRNNILSELDRNVIGLIYSELTRTDKSTYIALFIIEFILLTLFNDIF